MSIPTPVVSHCSFVYKGKLYVQGGNLSANENVGSVLRAMYVLEHQRGRDQSIPLGLTADLLCPEVEGALSGVGWHWMGIRPVRGEFPHKTGHSAVVYKDCVWFLFGDRLPQCSKGIWRYNLKTQEADTVNGLSNTYWRSGQTGVLYGNSYYVLGGWNQVGRNLSDFLRYDFDTDELHVISQNVENDGGPPALRTHTAVVYQDTMLVYGGWDEQQHGTSSTLYQYSFKDQNWKVLKTTLRLSRPNHEAMIISGGPRGRSRAPMALVHNKLYTFAGSGRSQDSDLTDMYELDLVSMEWREIDMMIWNPFPLMLFSVQTICNTLWVFGGKKGTVGPPSNDLLVMIV